MEIVYVNILPVYVRSFPTSSVFTRIWVMHFCLIVWFPIYISSGLLLQGTAMPLRKYKRQYLKV